MIKDAYKYGARFREIFYESQSAILSAVKDSPGNVHIYSYEELDLPKRFSFLRRTATLRIPVQERTDEDLLLSFRKTYRNEIRRSVHDEVSFEECAGISRNAYALYASFERSQGRRPYPYPFFKDCLSFTATKDGHVISGITCIPALPVLKVFAIYSLRYEQQDERALIGRASKRLVFNICKHAREAGYDFVDLAYVSEDPEKLEGIAGFKGGFGGERVVEYQYTAASPVVSFLRRLRKLVH